jgi:hypothetical protein
MDVLQVLPPKDRPLALDGELWRSAAATATITQQPKHGQVEISVSGYGYTYQPNDEFEGEDRFTLQTVYEEQRFMLHYRVYVFPVDDAGEPSNNDCSKWPFADSSTSFLALFPDTGISFSDLPGSSLAQTTGTGPTAQITLDTDAAGYGWFIDYTPYLNEEYLPTSNPYEWIAQPGSAAEGKIDRLSVLWHELGHAYGLDHTTDAHDFMATTLQPGVRRLPSAQELALLSPMLADSGWLAYASTLSDPSGQTPDTPNAPLPMSIGLVAFLASRQRRTTETPT